MSYATKPERDGFFLLAYVGVAIVCFVLGARSCDERKALEARCTNGVVMCDHGINCACVPGAYR